MRVNFFPSFEELQVEPQEEPMPNISDARSYDWSELKKDINNPRNISEPEPAKQPLHSDPELVDLPPPSAKTVSSNASSTLTRQSCRAGSIQQARRNKVSS